VRETEVRSAPQVRLVRRDRDDQHPGCVPLSLCVSRCLSRQRSHSTRLVQTPLGIPMGDNRRQRKTTAPPTSNVVHDSTALVS
jgi:hypothetical protein